MRYWLLTLNLLLFWTSLTHAVELPQFSSSFKVITFGAMIGHSKQTLKCSPEHLCTLTATAKPEGIARLFTSEWLWEQSVFEIKNGNLIWHQYQKKKYDNDRLKSQVTLIRQKENVIYKEGNRAFPLNTPIYDAISLPFAISLMYQQKNYPSTLYLQDNNWQDALTFQKQAVLDTLDKHQTMRFELKGQYIHATLHLLKKAPYLPYSIDIYNKKHKRHIILTLDQDYLYATQ